MSGTRTCRLDYLAAGQESYDTNKLCSNLFLKPQMTFWALNYRVPLAGKQFG